MLTTNPTDYFDITGTGGGGGVIVGRGWKEEEQRHVLYLGPNPSTMVHIPFLRVEFSLLVWKV